MAQFTIVYVCVCVGVCVRNGAHFQVMYRQKTTDNKSDFAAKQFTENELYIYTKRLSH